MDGVGDVLGAQVKRVHRDVVPVAHHGQAVVVEDVAGQRVLARLRHAVLHDDDVRHAGVQHGVHLVGVGRDGGVVVHGNQLAQQVVRHHHVVVHHQHLSLLLHVQRVHHLLLHRPVRLAQDVPAQVPPHQTPARLGEVVGDGEQEVGGVRVVRVDAVRAEEEEDGEPAPRREEHERHDLDVVGGLRREDGDGFIEHLEGLPEHQRHGAPPQEVQHPVPVGLQHGGGGGAHHHELQPHKHLH
mmetsp:Transcript_36408/g.89726  ORF Transcript_36408/g.89726 Transcript_36408/m.89726 type:complete len:241 (+) Transcript_36408:1252-1974(+)